MPQTVTSTADSGAGSLRQAIIDANTAGGDTISFAIAGAGPHIITLASALPAIATATQILGYSQSEAAQNTLTTARGSNAVLQIEINGAAVGSNPILRLNHAGAIAEGLALVSGSSTALDILGGTFRGGWIGVRANGGAGACAGAAITTSGIAIAAPPVVGGSNPGDRVIAGNCSEGGGLLRPIHLRNVQVGINAAGAFVSNGGVGFTLFNSGAVLMNDCLVANHTVLGMQVSGNCNGSVFTNCVFDENSDASWNRAFANSSSGIQLIDCTFSNYFRNGLLIDNAAGVLIQRCLFFGGKSAPIGYIEFGGTANQGIPTPTISAAATNSTEAEVTGAIAGAAASTQYRVEIFAGASGQMQRHLGSALITTDGSGAASWTATDLTADTVGQTVRATITRTGTNETSRQSSSFTLVSMPESGVTLSVLGFGNSSVLGTHALTPDALALTLDGTAGTSVLGTAAIAPDLLTLSPTGTEGSNETGAIALSPGTIPVTPSAHDNLNAFGAVAFTPALSVTGTDSTTAIGATAITPEAIALSPAGTANGSDLGTVTLTVLPVAIALAGHENFSYLGTVGLVVPNQIAPNGFANQFSFGAIAFTPDALPLSITGTENLSELGTAAIAPEIITLSPNGLETQAAIGTASLAADGLAIGLNGTANQSEVGAIGLAPDLLPLFPAGTANSSELGALTLTAVGSALSIPGTENTSQVGAIALSPNALTLSPPGTDSTAQAGSPSLTPNTIPLQAIGTGNASAIGAPTLTLGTLTLDVGGTANASAFGEPLLFYGLAIPGYRNESEVGAIALAVGTLTLSVGGNPSSNSYGLIRLRSVEPMHPSLKINSGDRPALSLISGDRPSLSLALRK